MDLVKCDYCSGHGTDEHGENCYTCQGAGQVESTSGVLHNSMSLNETGYCGCGNTLHYGSYCSDCRGE